LGTPERDLLSRHQVKVLGTAWSENRSLSHLLTWGEPSRRNVALSFRTHQIGSGAAFSRSMEKRLVTFRNGTAAINRR
jgi:hypothetical protein